LYQQTELITGHGLHNNNMHAVCAPCWAEITWLFCRCAN